MRVRSPFFLLCATGLFAIFSSTIAKSPVLPLFAAHLGASITAIGLIGSAASLAGIVISVPAGIFSDHFGRRRMLQAAAWIFMTAPLLYLFTDSIVALGATRLYHGLATAIFMPVALALVTDLYHQGRGEKIGLFSTATLAGRFVAPVAGGFLLGLVAADQAMGFRLVYAVCFLGGLAAFVLTTRLPASPNHAPRSQNWSHTLRQFKGVAAKPPILMTAAVEAAMLFMYGCFETFIPLQALAIGLTITQAGLFLSAQIVTVALLKPAMGRFADQHGRGGQIFWGALLGAGAVAFVPFVSSFSILLMISIGIGLSLAAVTTATSALIADLCGSEGRGGAMGLLSGIMDIGHTAGPVCSGLIAARFGLGSAFIGAAAVLGVTMLVFLASQHLFPQKEPEVS